MSPFRPVLLLLLASAPAGAVDYRNEIQAILKEHCWDCHSNEKEVKGGLAFDDLEDMAAGQINPNGLIRPGEPEKSDFLARLKLGEEEEDFMPREASPCAAAISRRSSSGSAREPSSTRRTRPRPRRAAWRR